MAKIIALFDKPVEANQALAEFKTQGMQASTAALTKNATWEVERAGFLLKKDRRPAFWAGITGVVLGGLLGYLHGVGRFNLPLILSWTAGGEWIVALAMAGVIGTAAALLGSLVGLLWPVSGIQPGWTMITVFCMAGQKKQAKTIIRRNGGLGPAWTR